MSDAAIQICNSVGMGLSDTYGFWIGGGGSSPASLGQDIIKMSNNKLSFATTGGILPTSQGNCD